MNQNLPLMMSSETQQLHFPLPITVAIYLHWKAVLKARFFVLKHTRWQHNTLHNSVVLLEVIFVNMPDLDMIRIKNQFAKLN